VLRLLASLCLLMILAVPSVSHAQLSQGTGTDRERWTFCAATDDDSKKVYHSLVFRSGERQSILEERYEAYIFDVYKRMTDVTCHFETTGDAASMERRKRSILDLASSRYEVVGNAFTAYTSPTSIRDNQPFANTTQNNEEQEASKAPAGACVNPQGTTAYANKLRDCIRETHCPANQRSPGTECYSLCEIAATYFFQPEGSQCSATWWEKFKVANEHYFMPKTAKPKAVPRQNVQASGCARGNLPCCQAMSRRLHEACRRAGEYTYTPGGCHVRAAVQYHSCMGQTP